MSTETMGKVLVEVSLQNLEDEFRVRQGLIPPDQARAIVVTDALVDTGATQLSVPTRLIARLGLRPTRSRQALTTAGIKSVQVYEAVRLTIQGRDCLSDVSEVPDECPVLIGQIPLEQLDFVVDLENRRLIGNPAHGGEHMIEI
jgi:predicted aspartyl protease